MNIDKLHHNAVSSILGPTQRTATLPLPSNSMAKLPQVSPKQLSQFGYKREIPTTTEDPQDMI